jgi:hypothetical protein
MTKSGGIEQRGELPYYYCVVDCLSNLRLNRTSRDSGLESLRQPYHSSQKLHSRSGASRAYRPICLKLRQEIVATHETFSDFIRLYR